MPETVTHDEQFYIVAEEGRALTPSRVLKQGDTFGVFDTYGDVAHVDGGEHGLYHEGTRFLSEFQLLLGRHRPLLLSSVITEDNIIFTADLTNPDILRDGRVVVARGGVHLFRSRALSNGQCSERIRVSNHALHPVDLPISLRFDADYADLFEVRGMRRAKRGRRGPDAEGPCYVMSYIGLDGVERRTTLTWSPAPDRIAHGVATFLLSLDRHASAEIEVVIDCQVGRQARAVTGYVDAVARARGVARARDGEACLVTSSSETFNHWIRRSAADLRMMITETPHGPYPYAGVPWFSTPFGRDGLITALELLWAAPDVARGVLGFLAETQATAYSAVQDAQPGKILHEMRQGEMAALGEIPFGRYYGSADATPLFVMLAAAYGERTGDRALIDRLWPNIVAALQWIGTTGDPDGDGFVEYARQTEAGLVQQGWKDSADSIFHADGSFATPPIALCEIQAYTYAAWRGAARLALQRGDAGAAADWDARAERLRVRFEEAFWCEDLGTYAVALDGDKRPCRVRTSNAGHCLFAGIASPARARRVAHTLLSEASFAGWGIRTVAAGEARYNPMSYHNGSIWPHDNALIGAGLARYGLGDAATRLMSAMLDLSAVLDLHRLPELICGFRRRESEFPTLYPVACAPQAWAAGTVYMLLASCLGLRIEAAGRRVSFSRALLPSRLEWLRLTNLSIGDARVDLLLTRHPHDIGVTVLRREGDVEIVAVK